MTTRAHRHVCWSSRHVPGHIVHCTACQFTRKVCPLPVSRAQRVLTAAHSIYSAMKTCPLFICTFSCISISSVRCTHPMEITAMIFQDTGVILALSRHWSDVQWLRICALRRPAIFCARLWSHICAQFAHAHTIKKTLRSSHDTLPIYLGGLDLSTPTKLSTSLL